MSKQIVSDEILMRVEKPARYLGGEYNMVVKNTSEMDVRFAMCFPDVYEVGMSHLGIQIIYDYLNRRDDTYCERVYSPWVDMDKEMRENNIELFSLETKTPIKEFDFLGITLQYEMCYTNILQILDLSNIPLLSKDRGEDYPIVIGGGPCVYNAEPIADFFDIFYIGEGEAYYYEMIDLYKKHKAQGFNKLKFLEEVCQIPGIYVPRFYEIEYNEDGTIKSIINTHNAPKKVKKVIANLDEVTYPTKPLVPFIKTVQDRLVLEIQRGCIRECRFCQAGSVYKPLREKSLETLKKTADEMLMSTGYEEISLSSLSTSDYSNLGEFLNYLIDTCNILDGLNNIIKPYNVNAA